MVKNFSIDVIMDLDKFVVEEPIRVFVGPLTRAQAKCFNEQFNSLVWRIQQEDSSL